MSLLSIISHAYDRTAHRLVGAVLEKELVISARKRRSYAQRCVYVILLLGIIIPVWLLMTEVSRHQSTAYHVARMSMAGKGITLTVLWFQFIVVQLMAAPMLSHAINDEITHRTLGILMTTPMTGLQIVIGKLFSPLLQLLLMIAVSLPVLAVVRVFGGVPWQTVVGGVAITVVAALFVGTVSLFASIKAPRPRNATSRAYTFVIILYVLVPWGTHWILGRSGIIAPGWLVSLTTHLSPLLAMQQLSGHMTTGVAPAAWFSWPWHCGVMLALTGLLIAWSAVQVRRAGLNQLYASSDNNTRPGRRRRSNSIRRVRGWPVTWKDLHTWAPGQDKRWRRHLMRLLVAAIVAAGYGLATYSAAWNSKATHFTFILAYLVVGAIYSLGLAASAISSEKERRTWPILLLTPLTNWSIILQKGLAVFLRVLPVWLLLAGHVLLFVLRGNIHPIMLLHIPLIIAQTALICTSIGLVCSAWRRKTSRAINIAILLLVIISLLTPLLGVVSVRRLLAHPVIQTLIVCDGAITDRPPHRWHRPNYEDYRLSREEITVFLVIYVAMYAGIAALLLGQAQAVLRRRLFYDTQLL